MRVIDSIAGMRQARAGVEGSVGFVPTMGYLHGGHLSLVRRARSENDCVVVSIFVNPTQFGPSEDYLSYPRDPVRDLKLLEQEQTDLVFMPSVEEMYPPGFDTYVEVGTVSEGLEGAHRPGHFRGVATVVTKLFAIVEPHRAYFGEKDAQQLRVIQKLVDDLALNLEVVPCPTIREPDGLAMSSRNSYLNPEERQASLVLFRALSRARSLYEGGERRAERLRNEMKAVIEEEPLARIEYVSVADPVTLKELDEIKGAALASMAVYIGRTRLIDNLTLGEG